MFNRTTIILLTALAVVLAFASLPSGAATPEGEKATTFLNHLKVGQAVALEDKGGRYQLAVYPENIRPLSHTVIEINQDCIVLRDFPKVTDTIIPVYSVTAITVLRVAGKPPD